LIAAYKAAKEAGLPFELVYVSSDRDEEGFDAYTEAMPWPAIKFSEEDARAHVKDEVFGIKGIPQLLVLSPQGKLLTNEGRNQVAKDKEAAIKAWCDAAAPAPAAEKKAEEFSTSEDF
jgi:nucleoredoxin